MDPKRFVFIDETATATNMIRRMADDPRRIVLADHGVPVVGVIPPKWQDAVLDKKETLSSRQIALIGFCGLSSR